MTPAMIGLLGVIAGGLLGGLVAYRVDRRKDKDKATVAARLIILELDSAIHSLKAAADDLSEGGWPTRIPQKQWDDHGAELVGFLERARSVRVREADGDGTRIEKAGPAEKLVAAYSAIGLYNSPDQLSAKEKKELRKQEALKETASALETTKDELQTWLDRQGGSRWWAASYPVRIAFAVIVVLAALAALGAGVLVAHPDATSQTVAAAIAAGLTGRQEVECLDEPGDAWNCTVYPLPGASACGASFRPSQRPTRHLAAVCKTKGDALPVRAVEQGDDVVAAPTTRAGRLLGAFNGVMEVSLPQRNRLQRWWDNRFSN